jgi:prevent-host-death family protein
MASKTIGAAAFKAKCLSIVDEVSRTGESVTITKRGQPVAELRPVRANRTSLYGAMEGSVVFLDDDYMVSPFDVEWDAMK